MPPSKSEPEPPLTRERVDRLLEDLQELASLPDNDDSGLFFRYKKIAPLVICRFINRIRSPHVRTGDTSDDPNDHRTPLMRRMQEEAEQVALPKNGKSNNDWITATDLAQKIAKESKRKTTPRGQSTPKAAKPQKEKIPVETAKATLASGRKNNRCLWRDKSRCGGDPNFRFWKTNEDHVHPVFY